MKKCTVIAIVICLLMSGCSFTPASPEDAAAKAAAFMAEGDAAMKSGELTAALENYQAAEELTPSDLGTVRGQIEALKRLSGSDASYVQALTEKYEALYFADGFYEADYLALAELYIEAGNISQARDLLEKGQCLEPTDEKAEMLDTLTADLAADSSQAPEALAPMLAKLSGGDIDGAAKCLLEEGQYSRICSRVPSGSRRYTVTDGGATVKVLAAYSDGQEAVYVWRLAADGTVTALALKDGALFIGTASEKNGSYDGAFTAEFYKAANGSIVVDYGTFAGGVAVGTVNTEIYSGDGETTLTELFAARDENTRTVYTGELDGEGHSTAAQAAGLEAGQIVYAYTTDNNNYTYVIGGEEDTAETYSFTPDTFGFEALPLW